MGDTTDLLQNPNTEFLVEKAKAGSDAAWRRIFERYRKMLEAHVRARIPGAARRRFDEDDVLQIAFINAWEHIQGFAYRGEGCFRRWLATLVVNAYQNELRRQRSERAAGEGEAPPLEELPNSETQVQLAEDRVAMLEAMGQLDDEDRDILIQRHIEEKSFDEIARIQGCPRESARTLYLKALERFRRRGA